MISDAMKRYIPRRLGLDPRAVVRRRRPVMLVLVRVLGVRDGAHAVTSARPGDDDVLDRQAGLLAEPLDEVAAKPAGAAGWNVETTISSTRSSCTASIAALNGSGCATWPWTSIPSWRNSRERALMRRSASGCAAAVGSLCGERMRKLGGRAARSRISREAARRARSRSRSRERSSRSAPPSPETRCSTGRSRRPSGSGRGRSAAASRTSLGCVETRISSTGGSSCASASRTRRGGIRLDDVAVGGNPGLAQMLERPLEPAARRRAARVAVDDVAALRLAHRRDDVTSRSRRARRERVAQRPRVDGLVRHDEDVRHSGHLLHLTRLATARGSRAARPGRRTRTASRRPAGSRRS